MRRNTQEVLALTPLQLDTKGRQHYNPGRFIVVLRACFPIFAEAAFLCFYGGILMSETRPASFSVPSGAGRVMWAQMLIVLFIAVVFFFLQGISAVQAALYGGMMALLNTWIAGYGLRKAAQIAKQSPGREVNVLYMGAVQRFVVTLVLFVLGMAWLKLAPVPLLVAFSLSQAAYMFRGMS